MTAATVAEQVAGELELPSPAVRAVAELLDGGATIPFIARYRKEKTGGLDEVQIRQIEERRAYLAELEARRKAVLEAIEGQGALTPQLRERLDAAQTKTELEDLYLPFRPKRRTRAQKARERGLEPLAARILAQPPSGDPRREAERFALPAQEVQDVDAALAGARDIAAEVVSERAEVRARVRRALRDGFITSSPVKAKTKERTKFEQYYNHRERVRDVPSHRYLAIRRGEEEGVLRVKLETDEEGLVAEIEAMASVSIRSPFAGELREAIRDGYRRLLAPSVEAEIRTELKERSDRAAVEVFAQNLRHLLLAAPLGGKRVIGVDPGLRTGCKCAAVDETGRYVATHTFYTVGGAEASARSAKDFVAFMRAHRPAAIAVGNGTGGREAEALVRAALSEAGLDEVMVVSVSETGASVYSASEVGRAELPDLDLTIRGAVSIARRLQDPLAELVKVDPKAIGVGQYQHDVHQPLLTQTLKEVVESCVNRVGVALNTASAPLLSYVAGVGAKLAKKIVAHREEKGAFRSRRELLRVSGLGPRAFEQAAGFLRIERGEHPLDASAVHPERYELVERMAADLGDDLSNLIGDAARIRTIDLPRYVGEGVGEPTLRDILCELEKPGRDPRHAFLPPRFREDVHDLADLRPGMALEGVVTNVTAFGAFVDVGVHQDGLVHVSKLADRFVKDPGEVVSVGQRLTVRVLDVDLERRRISLSARSRESEAKRPSRSQSERKPARQPAAERAFRNNPFGALKKS